MSSFYATLLGLTIIALSMGFISFMKQTKLSHRVVAIDFMGLVSASVLGIYCVMVNVPIYLDIIIVWALVNFLGTVAFSIYLQQENARNKEQKS
jgi:multicomponent Na+:H+ antiporter subunit F